MRHDGGHAPVVVGEGRGNLPRGNDHPARRVEDDLDRLAGGGLVDGTEDAFGVVDVDHTLRQNEKTRENAAVS
jgi:hypothetical protein